MKFTIKDALWLTVVVALCLSWYVSDRMWLRYMKVFARSQQEINDTHNALSERIRELLKQVEEKDKVIEQLKAQRSVN